ncbi:MAG: hypothetical protein JNJ49_09100 [Bdellovibrionaceae bacterium]|nr:hypothetical protein [Pseudobdellovibrionaceae bacterium]
MKRVMTILGSMMICSTVFAGAKDQKLLDSMLLAGASQVVEGDQSVAKMTKVYCSLSTVTSRCSLETLVGDDSEGSTARADSLRVVGSTAKDLSEALLAIGANSFESRTGIVIRLDEVSCSQPFKAGEIPGEDQTVCKIN